MRKLSVVEKVAIRSGILFVVLGAGFFLFFGWLSYQELKEQNDRVAMLLKDSGRQLLLLDSPVALNSVMDTFSRAGWVDFYFLKKGDDDLFYHNAAGVDDNVLFVKEAEEKRYTLGNYSYDVVREGDYALYIGQKNSIHDVLMYVWKQDQAIYAFEILLFTACVTLIVFLSSKDVRNLLKLMMTTGAKRGVTKIANSLEGQILAHGMLGAENYVDRIEAEKDLLSKKVLPSLQAELFSGKKPPYKFNCTLVRTDINNFSETCEKYDMEEYLGVIQEFFHGVSHIVSRYSGLIHEFVGDEVIFYFKDETCIDSAAAAISAVRDINVLAAEFDERTRGEQGYDFKVKSALSYGTLRYGWVVNGNSISGSPLIETTRILSQVVDKSRNSVLMSDSIRERIGDLCVTKMYKIALLKGYREAQKLHEYVAHVPLSNHLRQRSKESLRKCCFYRSDRELSQLLDFVREERKSLSKEELFTIFSQIRSYQVTRPSADIRQSYIALIAELKDENHSEADEDNEYLFSSVLMLALNFFSFEGFSGRVAEVLAECLVQSHGRVVANAVEVLAQLDPSMLGTDREFGLPRTDNRTRANALVGRGKAQLDQKVVKEVDSMLSAPSVYLKASGLYALGEIAAYWKSEDEVAFRANRDLADLLARISTLARHANKMVRRQAVKAAEKAGRMDEITAVLDDPRLLPEVREHLTGLVMQALDDHPLETKLRRVV